ncbi:circularly permuted type 2 ATP-grasp protein [Marinivivus vitaminiproducens]|uniref:circularly permuted type 2 ATP-grasp protein n=1 Tax=Marinivivus vitaminiproducens TaxID=3035935 RepID=UPI0027A2B800|nr:circularly permuted type 2 ATP-grasp protein [Geminicoccaceae bacterium SCSIO 64248]
MTLFEEMRGEAGDVRAPYRQISDWLARTSIEQLELKRQNADLLFRRLGVTFTVYGEAETGIERLIPFDILPRILNRAEWKSLEAGLIQRVTALNAFMHDVYHGQEIIKAGRVPAEQVQRNPAFRSRMRGVDLPGKVYAHIAGIDLVRTGPDAFYVLEDNLRTPSGVSYMLKNREAMMSLFPELFAANRVAPVQHYPADLLATLRTLSHSDKREPVVVLLTPGIYNSAFFEHAFLAEQMGVELVQGSDLVAKEDGVYMRTTEGPQRVDVIYRRIDDDYLDPLAFRPESALGVPGLFEAYRKGQVALANAIGAGVADDKAIYTYVPDMIRFYLGEEPILNNVPTWKLSEPDDLNYVLEHLSELVVKEVSGSGGYGMLVGPKASKTEIEAYRGRILKDPAAFIAQPTLALSTCPTLVDEGIAPRHVDLRPFVLSNGKATRVVPGGLTRVALRQGSLVVNSSQGGGTKDTWVLET